MATNTTTMTSTPPPPATTPTTPAPTLTTNSLVVTGLAIERPRGAKGSKLTYVTGLLQNEAAAKRFGVRVDLYLLDRAGRSVGQATDYTPLIQPNGSWRFRALVLDQRAVSARVKEIKENQ